MITTKISTDVLMTGAPLTALAVATGLEGHVSVQDVTPAMRDRVTTPDVFATVPGLPAWSPPM